MLYELQTAAGFECDAEVNMNTPGRVARAWLEMTSGYKQAPAAILSKTFATQADEMVVVSGLPYASTCAHHLLPFTGLATIAYIPNGRVVGLSKLPRLVHCFGRRLQIQEELTDQIAEAIEENLNPKGVGVLLTGTHTCMCLRGVKSAGLMKTTSLRGILKDDPKARAEFYELAKI